MTSSASKTEGRPSSISTHQSGAVAKGLATSGIFSARKSKPRFAISSKADTMPGTRDCASVSRRSAAAGLSTTSIAVTETAGRGTMRKVAAVMMPSVPSAPISRWRRS